MLLFKKSHQNLNLNFHVSIRNYFQLDSCLTELENSILGCWISCVQQKLCDYPYQIWNVTQQHFVLIHKAVCVLLDVLSTNSTCTVKQRKIHQAFCGGYRTAQNCKEKLSESTDQLRKIFTIQRKKLTEDYAVGMLVTRPHKVTVSKFKLSLACS